MWIDGLSVYDENNTIDWKWQAMDGAITKAPLGEKHRSKSQTEVNLTFYTLLNHE
jgi:hypothetical protein